MRSQSGFSLVELLVALTIFVLIFLVVLAIYSQGHFLATYVESNVEVQNNVRLAMQSLERDLRMIGFGVPDGVEIGGTALWTPAVFYGSPTEIGFRAEIDSGNSQITCTPKSTNSDCPLDELEVESTGYYDTLNCKQPDNPAQALSLGVVDDGRAWQRVDCSGVDVGDSSIDVDTLTDNKFIAGESEVLSIEQVYYRYVPQSLPPYGYLQRYVRYDNQPDGVFPPTGITWSLVANHLTNFTLEYQDAGGGTLTGNPLTSSEQESVAKIIVTMEGYDSVGAQGGEQLVQVASELLVRNAAL